MYNNEQIYLKSRWMFTWGVYLWDDPDQDQWFEISHSSHGIQWTNESLIPRVDWSVPLAWYDPSNLL